MEASEPFGGRHLQQPDLLRRQIEQPARAGRLVGAHRLLAQQRGGRPHLTAPDRFGEPFPAQILRDLGGDDLFRDSQASHAPTLAAAMFPTHVAAVYEWELARPRSQALDQLPDLRINRDALGPA